MWILRFLTATTPLFNLLLQVSALSPVRFDGAIVIRMTPQDDTQLAILRDIYENNVRPDIDFWLQPTEVGHPVDVRLGITAIPSFRYVMEEYEISYEVTIENLQELIDEERGSRRRRRDVNFFSDFREPRAIDQWLKRQVASPECNNLCELEEIGKSYEGKNLTLIKIGQQGQNKPIIWIDAGIHAREWIAPSTALYIANLLIQRRTDQKINTLLSTFDFYILPVVNPDGYQYTFQSNRMWRKSRSKNSGSPCYGTDLNRNFNFHWSEIGSEEDPCSDVYHGSRPFSEPETAALSRYVLFKRNSIKLFLTLHSYGRLWLTPWGWTRELPQDYQDLIEKANKATTALQAHRSTQYIVGSSARKLYRSSGASDDWAKGVAGIQYSYTIELPGDNNRGFMVPASEIIPTGEETFAAVTAITAALDNNYRDSMLHRDTGDNNGYPVDMQ